MAYQHELGGSSLDEVFAAFSPRSSETDEGEPVAPLPEEALAYARELARGTVEHRAEIDPMLEEGSTNWRLVRMSAVDRAILRVAVYELLYEPDVPKVVVVDEAIELAKRFGSEQSPAFVNGVLDGLLKRAALPGRWN